MAKTLWFWIVPLFAIVICCSNFNENRFSKIQGAIVRGDSTKQNITLVFTGDTFAECSSHILQVLKKHNVKGAFFFTGDFYRNPNFRETIEALKADGHYLGAHSDQHLLYCDWAKRDSLLITFEEFSLDIDANYAEMKKFGLTKKEAPFFLPPYEWYNDSIAQWTRKKGLQLINMTHGTLSHADYTTPKMKNYRSSKTIYEGILNYDKTHPSGLNGFMLLSHIGTSPERKDKFYCHLDELVTTLSKKYKFVRLEELLTLP